MSMTGKSVTYKTTFRGGSPRRQPILPDSWPDTRPGRRKGFPANTNRPPTKPPKVPGLKNTGQVAGAGLPPGGIVARNLSRGFGWAALAVTVGELGRQLYPLFQTADQALDVGGLQVGDSLGQWTVVAVQTLNSEPGPWTYYFPEIVAGNYEIYGANVSSGNYSKNYRRESAVVSKVDLVGPANPFQSGDQTAWLNYSGRSKFKSSTETQASPYGYMELSEVVMNAVGGATEAVPLTTPGVSAPAFPYPGQVTEPAAVPGYWELPFSQPYPYTQPQPVPEAQPSPLPRPLRNPLNPHVLITDYRPYSPPSRGFGFGHSAPPKHVREGKLTGRGTAILIAVARAMGEGLEWIEVLSDAFGFNDDRHKFFGDVQSEDLFDPYLLDGTEHMNRLEFLVNGEGSFSWNRFFDALAKKVAEDVVAGAVFKRAIKGAQQLGIEVYYSVTGPLS